ncbi:7-cyano-7-deazaguanine/7-aminomethyl-7-deazaguanine transporter [Granulosicoccaceae sp. 1_MG-2023]|nr:7-cyano-7-deazaguanine/7-aminomethyl-7-deazaguanine transporter [Granulosicoccaceae sp. 1_MG-2023]
MTQPVLPHRAALFSLMAAHLVIISASNYLVQFPVGILGFHTTWGAFTFPLIFLATDLTTRLFGAASARRIVLSSMLPALLASYLVSVLFSGGQWQGLAGLNEFNGFVARIALASFVAYVTGQLLDVQVFARLRRISAWWVAPTASTVFGSLLDTFVFFAIAFHQSSDAFMAANWVEIATLDYLFKLIVSLVLLVPAYGALMSALQRRFPAAAPV